MYNTNEAVKTLMIAREERNAVFLKRWFSRKEFTKMMDLLNESLDFQCTDKRDKVFGLLGIATDISSEDEEIRPDYESKVEDVYRRFVIWEIKKNNSLRSLSCASDRSKSIHLLPSWVPDFSQLEHTTNLMRFEKRVNFNATKKSKPQARFADEGDVLYLGGRAVDSIDVVGGREYLDPLSKNPDSDSLRAWHINSGWLQECIAITLKEEARIDCYGPNRSFPKSFGMTDERYEEFWRTLTCNHNTKMQPSPAIHGIWMKDYVKLILEEGSVNKDWVQEWLSNFQQIHAVIGLMNKNRRFCATIGGRIGMVPRSAAAGDIVCVLYGGRVPFVLRPCEKGYTLIGECYIHGLMDGEAMDMDQLESREFALC